QIGRADAALRPLGQEALHTAVFKRMEGNPCKSAFRSEQLPGGGQGAVELVELAVDRDAQRLEGPLGGVAAAEARRRGDRALDELDQLLGRGQRTLAHDRAGDLV